MDIQSSDWDALQLIATDIGFPVERIGSLRQRLESPPKGAGRPYLLLAGQPEAKLDLLLRRWLDADADLLRQVGELPVICGQKPEEVGPRLAAWATRRSTRIVGGHLIILQTPRKPTPGVLAHLSSLGYLDQLVLATRLGQPLAQVEREIAHALAPLAATVRVLVIALPGEDLTDRDAADLSSYSAAQMKQVGFDGRFLGCAVWYADGVARPGVLADPGKLLMVQPTEVASGRDRMADQAIKALLRELREQAEREPASAPLAVSDDDQVRLVQELKDYLSDLGKELERHKGGRVTDTPTLRAYVRDTLRSWGAYSSIEGHWLRYVERLRPGTQNAFFQEAETSLSLLDYEPGWDGARSAVMSAQPPHAAVVMRIVKRSIVACALGLAVFIATGDVFPASVATSAAMLLRNLAATASALIGYGLGALLFRNGPPTPEPGAQAVQLAAIHGWQQVEQQLLTWFSNRIRARPNSPLEQISQLSARLLPEEVLR